MQRIVIGTRGSNLSLIQTEIIKQKILTISPKVEVIFKIISTKGDRDKKSPIPLDTVGKGWFTKELDRAILDDEIDLAVHSLKDIPEVLTEGLQIAAVPEREDPRDVLVTKNNLSLEKLKKGAIIGTDSIRRKIQILQLRSDLVVKSIRGNVDSRLRKLDEEEYDGVILAAAGLKRLGLENRIVQYFEPHLFIPAPGQGALAIVIKSTNKKIISFLNQINDKEAWFAITAERAFSKFVGGGCKTPTGSYARSQKDRLTVYGMIGSIDGTNVKYDSIAGNINDASLLGEKLAKRLSNSNKVVVITRSSKENKAFKKRLEKIAVEAFEYPCINISENALSSANKREFSNIKVYDWIVFTSKNGVEFFMQTLLKLGIDKSILRNKRIAAVGPRTAQVVRKYNLSVHFIPTRFTTAHLASELKDIKNLKFFLPRANIASTKLTKTLVARGAQITNIPIYKTAFVKPDHTTLYDLINQSMIKFIIFTSPSTVKGFVKSIDDKKMLEIILHLPILSIGPVTTKAAIKNGFQHVYTAETHTIDGIIEKLKINK